MSDDTLLRLTGLGIPPYSARGIVETLTPIDQQGFFARSITSGTLLNLGLSDLQKYRIRLEAEDIRPPAFEAMWRGTELEVELTTVLAVEGSAAPSKPYVEGSVEEADGFTRYRPKLDVMVVDFSLQNDEWEALRRWSLTLEEI